MAVNVGTVYVDVRPDVSGFASQLNSTLSPVAAGFSRTLSSKLQSAGSATSPMIASLPPSNPGPSSRSRSCCASPSPGKFRDGVRWEVEVLEVGRIHD